MGTKSTGKRWTYAELARLPTSGSTRYEVIDDELVVTPSPSAKHQAIVTRLVSAMYGFAPAKELGRVIVSPFDVLLADGDYVEPDIVFARADRSHLVTERGVEGPPDLLVEVLSASTATRDRGVKLDRYMLFGVREYWIVDPDEETVEVWKLADGASEAITYTKGDALRWMPVDGGPELGIPLSDLLAT